MAVDTSPASEAVAQVNVENIQADLPGDSYGSITASAGVPLVRVSPPKPRYYTRNYRISYDNKAAAEQTVTQLVPICQTTVQTDVEVNGTTITPTAGIHDSTGGVPASGDWIVVKNEFDLWDAYHVASWSAGVITITVTSGYGQANGTGVATKLKAGSPLYFMGAPAADHSRRQFTVPVATSPASTFILQGVNTGLCTTPKPNQPILTHSGNVTTQGVMTGPEYGNVRI